MERIEWIDVVSIKDVLIRIKENKTLFKYNPMEAGKLDVKNMREICINDCFEETLE